MAATAIAANAQTKTAVQTEPAPSYGKYMEVEPLSFTQAKKGRKMQITHNAKRIDPVAVPDQSTQMASNKNSRVEGKLAAEKAQKVTARNDEQPEANTGR